MLFYSEHCDGKLSSFLTVVTFIVLALGWLLVFVLFQAVMFVILIWLFWRKIKSILAGFRQDMSLRNLIERVVGIVGSGDLRDNILFSVMQNHFKLN